MQVCRELRDDVDARVVIHRRGRAFIGRDSRAGRRPLKHDIDRRARVGRATACSLLESSDQ
jgi:hypothetical protein